MCWQVMGQRGSTDMNSRLQQSREQPLCSLELERYYLSFMYLLIHRQKISMFVYLASPLLVVEPSIFSCGHFNACFASWLLTPLKSYVFWGPVDLLLSVSSGYCWEELVEAIYSNKLKTYKAIQRYVDQVCDPEGWGSEGMVPADKWAE